MKIRTVKLMTGVGLSELVVLALEGYLQNLARDRRAAMNAVIAAADTPTPAEVAAAFAMQDFGELEASETGPAHERSTSVC